VSQKTTDLISTVAEAKNHANSMYSMSFHNQWRVGVEGVKKEETKIENKQEVDMFFLN
jgi:hypothetical protein